MAWFSTRQNIQTISEQLAGFISCLVFVCGSPSIPSKSMLQDVEHWSLYIQVIRFKQRRKHWSSQKFKTFVEGNWEIDVKEVGMRFGRECYSSKDYCIVWQEGSHGVAFLLSNWKLQQKNQKVMADWAFNQKAKGERKGLDHGHIRPYPPCSHSILGWQKRHFPYWKDVIHLAVSFKPMLLSLVILDSWNSQLVAAKSLPQLI